MDESVYEQTGTGGFLYGQAQRVRPDVRGFGKRSVFPGGAIQIESSRHQDEQLLASGSPSARAVQGGAER
jgi:hypothetical protein